MPKNHYFVVAAAGWAAAASHNKQVSAKCKRKNPYFCTHDRRVSRQHYGFFGTNLLLTH